MNLYELVVIPSGQYDSDDLINLGRNYWGFDTVLAATWLSTKTGTEASAVQGVTVNSENEQTNYRTGSEHHLDAMVNQFLSPRIAIGFHLYTYQQLTKDSGTPPGLGKFKGQSVGVGPELLFRPGLLRDHVTLIGTWLTDLEAKNRLEADYGMLQIVYTP